MALKFKVKKEDLIKVICGDDKGKEAKVISVVKKKNSILAEGINVVKKAIKKDGENNFKFIEKPIHISNVKLIKSSGSKNLTKKNK